MVEHVVWEFLKYISKILRGVWGVFKQEKRTGKGEHPADIFEWRQHRYRCLKS